MKKIITLIITVFFSFNSYALSKNECLINKLNEDAKLQIKMQNSMIEIINSKDNSFEEILKRMKEKEIALIKKKQIGITYLLQKNPNRFNSLSEALTWFEFDEDIQKELIEKDLEYKKVIERISKSKYPDKKIEELGLFISSIIEENSDIKTLIDKLNKERMNIVNLNCN